MPGISANDRREAFVEQIVESLRRDRFVRQLRSGRALSAARSDPASDLFDPLKGAAYHLSVGNVEEAIWLVFLFVHFGRHRRGGWRYARDVYGRRGGPVRWDWDHVSSDPTGFSRWLQENVTAIRNDGPGGFGNHRKYERLEDTSAVVESYVAWVGVGRSQLARILEVVDGDAPDQAFEKLFTSLGVIERFGRTACFDYASIIYKLDIASIRPSRPHLEGATGPQAGARLLLEAPGSAAIPVAQLEAIMTGLARALDVAGDVLEDATCNWQKSPASFRPFRA